jgi:hypothetical protein
VGWPQVPVMNVGVCVLNYTELHFRRQEFSESSFGKVKVT